MRAHEIRPSKLVIFDIDDTLVHTQTKVHVVQDGRVVKSLNSHDFTHYKLQPGQEFDFGAFRNAREFFENSKPIIPMMNQLKQDIATGNKVVMVTARADFDDRELFLDTFRKYGVDMSKVHVYRAGNMAGKMQTEEKKKIIIRELLNSGRYTKAIMYDDAVPNLDAFLSLHKEYPHTKFYAWHVSLEGESSEYQRTNEMKANEFIYEGWSAKYKKSINCSHPKGFSQKAHCAGKKKHTESVEMEMVCESCGMCQTHGSLNEIAKGAKDSNGFTKCWPGKHAAGTKKGKNGGQVRNCVPNESQGVAEDSEHNVGDTVKNSTKVPGFDKSARSGEGKITKKTATHYTVNGREMPHSHIKSRAQGVAEGSENNNPIAQKIFFARSNKTPKGWSYDHVGFITQDGKQIQMSGHKGNDVYVTNAVTDDPEFPKQNIKIVSLSKPVSVPTTNSVGAENCGTFVANVLQANGIKGIDTQKIYSVFKKPQEQGVAEDWNKVNHHDKTNGLSQKAVNAYRRENPGSKLKTAVTTKPSKLKPGSKAAKRRKSFCARMSGNKGPMKKPNGKPTPKALALRRWNCESIEEMQHLIQLGEAHIAQLKNDRLRTNESK